jgi:hypothetical protein
MKKCFLTIILFLLFICCAKEGISEYVFEGRVYSSSDSSSLRYVTITLEPREMRKDFDTYPDKISTDASGYYTCTFLTNAETYDATIGETERIDLKDIRIFATYQATGFMEMDTLWKYQEITTENVPGKNYPKYLLPNVYLKSK